MIWINLWLYSLVVSCRYNITSLEKVATTVSMNVHQQSNLSLSTAFGMTNIHFSRARFQLVSLLGLVRTRLPHIWFVVMIHLICQQRCVCAKTGLIARMCYHDSDWLTFSVSHEKCIFTCMQVQHLDLTVSKNVKKFSPNPSKSPKFVTNHVFVAMWPKKSFNRKLEIIRPRPLWQCDDAEPALVADCGFVKIGCPNNKIW